VTICIPPPPIFERDMGNEWEVGGVEHPAIGQGRRIKKSPEGGKRSVGKKKSPSTCPIW